MRLVKSFAPATFFLSRYARRAKSTGANFNARHAKRMRKRLPLGTWKFAPGTCIYNSIGRLVYRWIARVEFIRLILAPLGSSRSVNEFALLILSSSLSLSTASIAYRSRRLFPAGGRLEKHVNLIGWYHARWIVLWTYSRFRISLCSLLSLVIRSNGFSLSCENKIIKINANVCFNEDNCMRIIDACNKQTRYRLYLSDNVEDKWSRGVAKIRDSVSRYCRATRRSLTRITTVFQASLRRVGRA